VTGLRSIGVMAVILAALAAVYVLASRPADVPEDAPRPALWSAAVEDLVAVTIDLPEAGRQGAWVRGGEGDWHGAGGDRRKVDPGRWQGVSLLLSAPRAERLIMAGANPEQLASYGLLKPRMTVELVLADDRRIRAEVGDPTPGGSAFYIRHAASTDVYTVHRTWFEVLERLVVDPPYASNGG
jgi:Domain of unknown function (DUF4340)